MLIIYSEIDYTRVATDGEMKHSDYIATLTPMLQEKRFIANA